MHLVLDPQPCLQYYLYCEYFLLLTFTWKKKVEKSRVIVGCYYSCLDSWRRRGRARTWWTTWILLQEGTLPCLAMPCHATHITLCYIMNALAGAHLPCLAMPTILHCVLSWMLLQEGCLPCHANHITLCPIMNMLYANHITLCHILHWFCLSRPHRILQN